MIRDLEPHEIEDVLKKGCYAHIACCKDAKRPYLVPITYAYKDSAAYAFSFEGEKIDIMRKQPHVCLQVEELYTEEGWRSVMAWGTFQELHEDDANDATNMILDKLWKQTNKGNPLFLPFRNSAQKLEQAMENKSVVMFRVNLDDLHGRMEEYEWE